MKRILGKFDDLLCGFSPEEMVRTTQRDINKLLLLEEGRVFFRAVEGVVESSGVDGNTCVRKLTQTVAPNVPITLRNKSFDVKYFRTALHLLASGAIVC